MDYKIFSISYKLIYFSLPLNSAIHRMGNASNILCPILKEQKDPQLSTLFYILLQAFQNYSRLYQWTNQSEIRFPYPFQNYSQNHHNGNFFSIPWWCTVNILPTLYPHLPTHDGVQLTIYPHVSPWCSAYHHCTTSFSLAWTQVLRRFKPCSQRVEDSQWWGSLTMVPARNKAKRFSSVNHITKSTHHHHHPHHHLAQRYCFWTGLKNTFVEAWSSLLNNNGTLIYNSTIFLD